METVRSVRGVPIRLTYERWVHIVENHDYLSGRMEDVLETVQKPDFVLRGRKNAKIAVKNMGHRTFLCVIYKETTPRDGFIITAFIADHRPPFQRIWPRK